MSASHPTVNISSTTSAPASETTSGPRRRGCNAADVHYLQGAREALGPIMAASMATATSGRSHHVRGLARLALAEQADQLAAITAALDTWGRLDALAVRTPPTDAAPGLHGTDQDRVFADQLSAHAHASLTSARDEMIAGVNRTARSIAEQAIHAHDRRLAALSLLYPPATPQS